VGRAKRQAGREKNSHTVKGVTTKSIHFTAAFLVGALTCTGCSSSSSSSSPTSGVQPKGNRILSIDTNDAAQDFTFAQSFAAAQTIGVSAGTFHLDKKIASIISCLYA
jgi:hypothetical protein